MICIEKFNGMREGSQSNLIKERSIEPKKETIYQTH